MNGASETTGRQGPDPSGRAVTSLGAGPSLRNVTGRAVPLRGDSIDTDRILPARYLRCVTFEGLEAHVFEDDRKAAGTGDPHPFAEERYRGAKILVVGDNFGCGSSREHAPQGLMRWGIRALVGQSFAEIFFGNCVAMGLPCATLAPRDLERLFSILAQEHEADITVDVEARAVTVRRKAGGVEAFPASLPEGPREAFLNGTWDAMGALLRAPEAIDAVAASLPYVRGFI
jgi:3-isopropylmalate/(R)-2-methylmalate dehydratase small subunit